MIITLKLPDERRHLTYFNCPFMEEEVSTNIPYCFLTNEICKGVKKEKCPILSFDSNIEDVEDGNK